MIVLWYSVCILVVALTFGYCLLMRGYVWGWNSLAEYRCPPDFLPRTRVSVLIPARNEADNIAHCLQAILNQDFPLELLEIIVIDDHSQDQTADIVRHLSAQFPIIRLLSLADHLPADGMPIHSYKKKALEVAIQQAKGSLIVCTDADCRAQTPYWLTNMVAIYETENPVCIAAPVLLSPAKGWLQYFQQLDFMGMMLITGAGIAAQRFYMSNGANMAYPKWVFEQVNGFEGNTQYASGDDMFLLQKIARQYPHRIAFLRTKQAIIQTAPMTTWSDFLRQRLRWATKSTGYIHNRRMQGMLLVVAGFHLALLGSLWLGWQWFAGAWAAKCLADYGLLRSATRFFGYPLPLTRFGVAVWMHWAYIVVIGVWANVQKNYRWKGRQVR